jgi:hypothetical protein
LGASTLIDGLLATGCKDTNEFRDHFGSGRVVDVSLLAAALHQAGAAQDIEMVRQRRARNLQLRLNVSSGHFRLSLHKKEEDLQPRLVRERLERFNMLVARLESTQWKCLHVFKYIEM